MMAQNHKGTMRDIASDFIAAIAVYGLSFEKVAAELEAAAASHAQLIRFELDPRGGEIMGSPKWMRAIARQNRDRRRRARSRRYIRVSVRQGRR